jgi:hypothetical protein
MGSEPRSRFFWADALTGFLLPADFLRPRPIIVKTLKAIDPAALSFPQEGLSWKLDGN